MKKLDLVTYHGNSMSLIDVVRILQKLSDDEKLLYENCKVRYAWTTFLNHPQSEDVILNVELLINNKAELLIFRSIEQVNNALLQMREEN